MIKCCSYCGVILVGKQCNYVCKSCKVKKEAKKE